jgi:DNA-directed RNA polymerase subunit omega
MIEAFRHDDLVNKCGGRFKLASLVQRRWLQIMQGARPMVETEGLTDIEVVVQELLEDKISFELLDGSEDQHEEEG